jgi:hypothetical protein
MVQIPRPRPTGQSGVAGGSLRFPLDRDPHFKTVITFSEYLRPNPDSSVAVGETRSVVLPLPLNIPDNTVTTNESASLGPFWRKVFNTVRKGYGDYETTKGGFEGLLEKWKVVSKSGSELTKSVVQDFTGGANDFEQFVALNPGMKDSGAQRYAQTQVGMVLNPHTTLMFDGVNLKTYSLQFKCSPRSRQENAAIQSIVQLIKERMLPTRSPNNFALNYPDTVNISFENTVGLPKINKSFLTNFGVVYTSGTGVSFYEDGKPLEYMLEMTLTEIEIRTREMIDGSEPELTQNEPVDLVDEPASNAPLVDTSRNPIIF